MLFDIPLYEDLPPHFGLMFVFLGALLGSFFNVLSMRWPDKVIAENDTQAALWLKMRGQRVTDLKHPHLPLLAGRSHCPSCTKKIPLNLNIPLLSWIMLRGKSSCCKKPISIRYIAWELIGAAVFTGVLYIVGPSFHGLVIGIALMWLMLISEIDFKAGLIPDGAMKTLAVIVALLCTHPSSHGLETAFFNFMLVLVILGAPLLIFSYITGKEACGISDVYLLGLSCALLGWQLIPAAVLMFALFIITALLINVFKWERGIFVKIVNEKAIPAAPAICLSTAVFYLQSYY